jgi:glyceraldehyde 3-phosphate dehydrogenase-like protein/6-phosphogluconate dehydrogenase-like protein
VARPGVDIVLECTGVFTHEADLTRHVRAGAKFVILSAPLRGGDNVPTVVHGVNTGAGGASIISCASCTTNCITPVMEILGRRIGILKATMTTVHAYTASQALVDRPSKDRRRGRAAATNLVPASTGAAKATIKALPEYHGKFDGVAIRARRDGREPRAQHGRPRLPRRRLQPDDCRHAEVRGRAPGHAWRIGGDVRATRIRRRAREAAQDPHPREAGLPVDSVVEQLLGAGVETDDIVVDCGNSLWTDTIRREKQYAERCRFFGSGVSGGEVGARFGPSLMPGGHPASWEHLRPIWEAIAAKVDPKTGKPLEDWAPGKPVTGGQPAPRRSTSGPSPPSGVAAASFERASSRRSPRPTAVTPAS